jgi:hypothetical protein
MDGAQAGVLIGGPGPGKTHVAALGVQAIEHHRRKVRFFPTIELFNALEQEKAKEKAGKIAENLTKLDIVIPDELGCSGDCFDARTAFIPRIAPQEAIEKQLDFHRLPPSGGGIPTAQPISFQQFVGNSCLWRHKWVSIGRRFARFPVSAALLTGAPSCLGSVL